MASELVFIKDAVFDEKKNAPARQRSGIGACFYKKTLFLVKKTPLRGNAVASELVFIKDAGFDEKKKPMRGNAVASELVFYKRRCF